MTTEAPTNETGSLSTAIRDVIAERNRQINQEGFTSDHDDEHLEGALSLAAACYACTAASWLEMESTSNLPLTKYSELATIGYRWPWQKRWWKPANPRRDLVKAAALILAEIERIDRKSGELTPC